MIQKLLKGLARRILRNELATLKSTIRHLDEESRALHDQIYHLKKEKTEYLSKPPEVRYGISREVWKNKVLRALEQPVMNSTVTPQHTGYLLGIQRAIHVLEVEIVHD